MPDVFFSCSLSFLVILDSSYIFLYRDLFVFYVRKEMIIIYHDYIIRRTFPSIFG